MENSRRAFRRPSGTGLSITSQPGALPPAEFRWPSGPGTGERGAFMSYAVPVARQFDREGDRPVLLTALTGRRVPLTDANLARLTLKYPLITLRVITLIHWHALKLWWKKVPWHRKAANPHLQQGVFNPHESLRAHSCPCRVGSASVFDD